MPEHDFLPPVPVSEEGLEAVMNYLRSLRPGYQDFELFTELARLGGLDTVEVLPVRTFPKGQKNVEVGLVRRSDDDPFWPGILHVAGSIIRGDDPIRHEHDFDPAIDRALSELGNNISFPNGLMELETVHRRGKRGREVTIRFWGEAEGQLNKGEFYDAADVLRHAPELGVTDSHAALIEKVAGIYLASRENSK